MIVPLLHLRLPVGFVSTVHDVEKEGDNTYFAFSKERYKVQKTPHVDWNGTRYGKGI